MSMIRVGTARRQSTRARVWRCRSDAPRPASFRSARQCRVRIPFLMSPVFIDHQHCAGITEMPDHIVTHIVAHSVVVPRPSRQQILHPVRQDVAGVLGDGPAVLSRQTRHQSHDQVTRVAERLPPREPWPDPRQHLLPLDLPPINVYADSRSRRLVLCSHKPRSCDGGCSMPSSDTLKITI